jgi:thiamine pyrophosphokinase
MPAEGRIVNETVVVITGAGAIAPAAAQHIPDGAVVVAADGALDHALAAGLAPAWLVGDMDSISPAGLEWASRHATIERHDPDKDQTDTELALLMAADLQPARLILIGAGHRLDHVLAAIGALGHPHLTSIPVIDAWWDDQWIRVVHGPGSTTLELAEGTTLSLLALHGPCSGVTITGVRWPLERSPLAPLVGVGVSNVAVDPEVAIRVSTGVLTIVIPGRDSSDSTEASGS